MTAPALAFPAAPALPRRLALLAVAILAILGVGTLAGLAPEPSPVPKRWQLDVEFGPLRTAVVKVDGVDRLFYTLTYKATNNSGQDVVLAPAFDLVGEDGKVHRSGRGVPAEVTKTLLARLGNPYLEDQIAILGTLQQGPENAREGLVIWPVTDISPGEVVVYAAGFSGETAFVDPPAGTKGERVTLRKSRMLRHAAPGELANRRDDPLARLEERWIMR